MEPMTLGSAPSSPSSPQINPNFLPGFLMGEPQPSGSPNLNTSPGRHRNNSGSYGNRLSLNSSHVQEPRNLRQKLFNQSINESTLAAAQSPFVPLSEKGGPPKQSLFDTIDGKKTKVSTPLSSTMAPYGESAGFNESFSRITEDSLNVTRNFNESVVVSNNTTMLNRFEKIDTLWVTVFGFPPSALSTILAHFSNCGTVVEKHLPTQGNWVHLKFNTLNEVARALSLNGKCISNSIMVGVSLHYNKDNKENVVNYTSPIRARSLRQSFTSPNLNNSVITPHNVPQKSTGIVTKAMEFVFGW